MFGSVVPIVLPSTHPISIHMLVASKIQQAPRGPQGCGACHLFYLWFFLSTRELVVVVGADGGVPHGNAEDCRARAGVRPHAELSWFSRVACESLNRWITRSVQTGILVRHHPNIPRSIPTPCGARNPSVGTRKSVVTAESANCIYAHFYIYRVTANAHP